MISRRIGYWSAAMAALTAMACSGGSSPAPPAFDATGYWMTWFEDPSTMVESGPYGSYVSAAPSGVLDGVGLTGRVSGNNMNMNVNIGIGTLAFAGAMAGIEVAGTVTFVGFPGPANFRMQQFTPTGTLNATGTVGGTAVSAASTTAYCERYYNDVALTMLNSIDVVQDDGTTRFALEFDQPGTLAVGTVDASVDPVSVIVWNDSLQAEIQATSGTVTVTQYDASGFAGSYSLMLPGAESVSGDFAVIFDLDVYDG